MGCLKIRQVELSFILLCALGLFSGQAIAQVARAVPTFHAIGIYYSTPDGDESNTCGLDYKIAEEETWKAGLDLWYDVRNNEYRGSLVNLVPGLTYQIKISCQNPLHEEFLTATTWREQFAVGNTVHLPAGTLNSTVTINDSGTADGYVLYTHPADAETVIDVDNAQDHCLEINASYVIIRGLKLKNAGIHGIKLLPGVHDVIIENCDISGWGRLDTLKDGSPDPSGFGINEDAGIYSDSADIEKIIIQRNKIHHPRYDTNSWREYREKYEGTNQNPWHPSGPKAITLKASGGNHVIRYNEIFSDDDHYFNDCIGESKNFGIGFPNADTDIYGNYLERSWDDAIESEGYNRNVRIWGNYIDRSYIGIAAVPVHQGPLYIWENVIFSSRKGPTPADNAGAPLFKLGGVTYGGEYYGDGKLYIFHNTSLIPRPVSGLAGHSTQLNADGRTLRNCVSRNNILQSAGDGHYAIYNRAMNPENDFDFDLYNGLIYWGAGSFEHHGINDKPVYVNDWGIDRDEGTGIFFLKDWSPGFDAGQVIASFNDDYSGSAPDLGAHEAGTPPMEFGVQASYLNPRGLIGYWPFDESAASAVVLDKSGRGNQGAIQGNVTRADGKSGRALQFNGNNDYVEIVTGNQGLPETSRDLSISLWIKRIATAPGDEYFIAKGGSFLWKISNNIPYFTIFTSEAHVIAPAPLAVDQWQHLSAVYDYSNQEVRIYIDGQLSVTQAVSGEIASNNAGLFLGHPSDACFNGLLDDVRIYNRILSEDELRELSQTVIPENELAGQWSLDEGQGSTASDSTENINHGTLYGDTAWMAGKTGQALKFDGNTDYVVIADETGALELTKDFSISLWLYVDRNTHGDEWFLYKTWAFAWKLSNLTPYFYAWAPDLQAIGAPALSLAKWHHLVATYVDATRTVTIYVDGQAGDPVVLDGDVGVSADDLWLGFPSEACLDGRLDEISIYSKALSAQEVQELYGQNPDPVLGGHWSMDDGSGAVFSDSSGNDNHGILYGDTAWSNGRTGPALKFDGDADYAMIPGGSETLALDQDFSISLWLYANRNTGGDEWFLWKGDTIRWKLSNLTPYFYAWNRGLELHLVDAPQLTLQQWHHLVATYDSESKSITIYLDGQAGAPLTISGDLNVTPDDVMLGHHADAGLDGKIDEMTIFNSVLGPLEVNDLFIPQDLPGDLNADGVVDRADIQIIITHRNQSADACLACDLDEDGTITVSDARKGVLLCTCPRCMCP